MPIKGSKKYNLRYNSEIAQQPEFGKMINGQGLGAVATLRYGICHMSFNGCEVIAVHNALVYINKPQPLTEVVSYMERFRVLMGFFGCNAYRLGRALGHYGAAFERVRRVPDDAEAFLITFWNKLPLLSTIHTVFCVREGDKIRVYNMYNSCPTSRVYGSISEIAGRHRPIAVYVIDKAGSDNKETP